MNFKSKISYLVQKDGHSYIKQREKKCKANYLPSSGLYYLTLNIVQKKYRKLRSALINNIISYIIKIFYLTIVASLLIVIIRRYIFVYETHYIPAANILNPPAGIPSPILNFCLSSMNATLPMTIDDMPHTICN